MKIIALEDFSVPGKPAFYKGTSYDILDNEAKFLKKRGLVEEVKTQTMVEKLEEEPEKQPKKVKKQKSQKTEAAK